MQSCSTPCTYIISHYFPSVVLYCAYSSIMYSKHIRKVTCACVTIIACCWYITGFADYTPGPYNVTISAGKTSVAFDIAVNNDNVSEGNETFHLTINPSLLPEGVTVNGPCVVSVTIVDDDSE